MTVETITIGNKTIDPGYNFQGRMYANGMKHFASGGFASGIYAGVNGGIQDRDRILAEKEMGVPWETYISGRAQDRDRNIGILQKTGQMLDVGGSGSSGGSVQMPSELVIVDVNNLLIGRMQVEADGRIKSYDDAAVSVTRGRLRRQ
ncbi:MAG TPA: hypothetical protein DIW46_06445 [Microbacterium sp.]|nr:hypothetical protein [Microbacterium sp.]